MEKTIAVDSRGRTNLGKAAQQGTYRLTKNDDGSILLEPVRALTKTEIALLAAHPNITESLIAAQDGTAKGVSFDWERDQPDTI